MCREREGRRTSELRRGRYREKVRTGFTVLSKQRKTRAVEGEGGKTLKE